MEEDDDDDDTGLLAPPAAKSASIDPLSGEEEADMKTFMSEPIVDATATIADESEEVADVKIFSLIAPKKPVGLAAKDPFGSDDDNEDFFAAKPKAASVS